ncbi:hypothetical protein LSTR_LSTR014267 [Laodelphax striatellus]|uniref:Uncharacterized protein n=1 Tax=Laodelphax striatellus TaxID=195883 RepID=A0A482XNK9_LAOST|nr:hypothetical protein LSTR_LSTR014267 [Laodelphax striatellus]
MYTKIPLSGRSSDECIHEGGAGVTLSGEFSRDRSSIKAARIPWPRHQFTAIRSGGKATSVGGHSPLKSSNLHSFVNCHGCHLQSYPHYPRYYYGGYYGYPFYG